MKQYIGTKMVEAAPAVRMDDGKGDVRIELLENNPIPKPGDAVDMGYKVRYEDGYESWSPQAVFEKAYRRTDGMNFGLAIEAAKMGKRIARKGWNGKEQYVVLGCAFSYLPYEALKQDDRDMRELLEYSMHEDIGSAAFVFCGTRGTQVGWLASQADMLADDWYITE